MRDHEGDTKALWHTSIIDRRNTKACIHHRSKKHYDMPFMIDEGITKAHIHGGGRKEGPKTAKPHKKL